MNKFSIPVPLFALNFFILILALAISMYGFIQAIVEQNDLAAFSLLSFQILVIYGGNQYIRMPYAIDYKTDGQMVFYSVSSSLAIHVTRLEKVKRDFSGNFLSFYFDNRKLVMLNNVADINSLIRMIKDANPNVSLAGFG